MGRGKKSGLPANARVLAGQVGAEVADKGRVLKSYFRGKAPGVGSAVRQAKNLKSMVKGGVAGAAAVELADAGFKAGRKILKGSGKARHARKLTKQQNERSKNKARDINIRHKRGEKIKPLDIFD